MNGPDRNGGFDYRQTGDNRTGGENPHAQRPVSQREARKKILRPTRHRRLRMNAAVVIMAAVFLLILCICLIYSLRPAEKEPYESPVLGSDNAVVPETADTEELDVSDGFETLTVPNSTVREGDLILVNYAYAHVLPEDNDIVSVYDYKTKSYKVNNTLTQMSEAVIEKFNALMDDFYANSGCGDIMIVSGYRSVEDQQRIYQDRVETEGAAEAAKYVALPGYSEHHTGLAMDLTVYFSDGTSDYLANYEPTLWFREHAAEYGFVLRYPESKAEVTKISYESWHYRYVGTPHAQIMTEKDLCLEEYTVFLRDYRYNEKYLLFKDGVSAESDTFSQDADAVIYYIPASSGDTTQLCVPSGCEYTVSGNNVDGFVITSYPNK